MTGTSGSILQVPYADKFNELTLGESTMERSGIVNLATSTGTGELRLSYFTARKSEPTTQARMVSGSTAAGATPTLVRWGLFLIAANGDGTLVAATANDTALFAIANTPYTRAWLASYNKVYGQRYAWGTLVVTGATAPTLCGQSFAEGTETTTVLPRITGRISGLSDLPASFVNASVVASGIRHYAAILP